MTDPLCSPVESSDLARVRSRLAEERRLAKAQTFALTAQLEEIIASSQFVATDDEHDPDGSTVAFERSKTSALLAHFRDRLAEIDSALERLEAGTYGVCEYCGVDIPQERLLARPVARHCVRCAAGEVTSLRETRRSKRSASRG